MAGDVDIDEVTLVRRGAGARDRQFYVAIDGVRHRRVQDDFRTQAGERARRLGEPHVVTDGKAEASHLLDVEDDGFRARRDTFLVRVERKHFSIARDYLARRIDDRGSV